MPYLILDLETVSDTTMWQPAPTGNGKGKSKKAPEDQVAPPYAQRPIVVGYALFNDAFECTVIGAQGTEDEVGLVRNLNSWLDSIPDVTIVTWNGRRFDIPVLAFRSIRHGLPQRWLTKEHRARYSDQGHIDLFDVFTEYNQLGMTGFSLDTMAMLIGLPGKTGVDGSKVAGMHAKGEWAKLQGYCTCDVAKLAFLMFRHQLQRGRITEERYREIAAAFWAKCVELNLGGVTFGADQARLLLRAVQNEQGLAQPVAQPRLEIVENGVAQPAAE